MSAVWLAGSSPPACPHCNGPVEKVTTIVSQIRRINDTTYTTRPSYRDDTYRCSRCGSDLAVPPSVTITERR